MAHGDRAAVDVDLLHVEPHVAHEAQDDRGEGLVDLDEVELLDADARLGQRLARGRGRAGQHDRRVGAAHRGGEDACLRLHPEVLARLLVADGQQRRAVDDARAVARRVDVLDALDQWYFCSATASKPPISPIAANDGLSWPSVSSVVPGRMNSSASSTTFSLRSLTGTTLAANLPESRAAAARSCERTA